MPASSPNKDRLQEILGALQQDAGLLSDFNALCDFGGRRAGTDSERSALAWLRGKLSAMGGTFRSEPVTYAGWTQGDCSLSLIDGTPLVVNPLLGAQATPPEGLVAEVVDLGRGTEEDFARLANKLPGRIALVRHEYMFSSQTIHRRRKLGWATERGAVGFLIASPGPGIGPVSGSSGRAGGTGIPAAATDYESAQSIIGQTVRLVLNGTDHDSTTEILVLDLPGRTGNETGQCVVLSAHVDGHDLAESALDNATGVAVALAVTRAFAPHLKNCEQGLRLCIFSAEEWALAGSKLYLDRMSQTERARMQMNINLDTVAGDDQLTALTSDFPALDAWVKKVATENGLELGTYLPTMQNSDHFHFARHGIPAMRIVAGFDRRESSVQHVLTPLDTRNKAKAAQLARAGRVTTILTWNALNSIGEQLAR